ncbi:uncharacterized protein BCR38DRAFT_231870 [Pseudomassariella vexata]|uniref:Uncharacterized protein n=1 Tax=Pseudomassariella vexata TaxID=1141098 RepID=A0A1Y2DWD8_9PEZI|nr:uncharacterized protein BCR38DRAFT_231870 [Pseudomassariella vexata]ORY63588.1 hypothetical protein BCR38DRAFT_231870 [Pseudomassariella vexata]
MISPRAHFGATLTPLRHSHILLESFVIYESRSTITRKRNKRKKRSHETSPKTALPVPLSDRLPLFKSVFLATGLSSTSAYKPGRQKPTLSAKTLPSAFRWDFVGRLFVGSGRTVAMGITRTGPRAPTPPNARIQQDEEVFVDDPGWTWPVGSLFVAPFEQALREVVHSIDRLVVGCHWQPSRLARRTGWMDLHWR